MTDAPELLPCPFCGGGADVSADMNAYPQIACDACGASCGSGAEPGVTAAIAAWNTRSDLSTFDAGFAAGVEAAAKAVSLSAWKHSGDDARSQAMDAGARHQVRECETAIRALAAMKGAGT